MWSSYHDRKTYTVQGSSSSPHMAFDCSPNKPLSHAWRTRKDKEHWLRYSFPVPVSIKAYTIRSACVLLGILCQ